MSDLFPNDERPLTPKNALADLDYLRDNGFWEYQSLLVWTRKYWVPMYERQLRWELLTRTRFNEKGRPREFALQIRAARNGLERALSLKPQLEENQ